MSARAVAKRFGVSHRTVTRLATQQRLPALKIGGQWRFKLRDVEQHISTRDRN
ncbi:MAG: helix-turn-helix domain-containing protein [Phycisphaerales bacterium]|nr:helix-turn-helix domain-containing protein [Phycisphaerales bacterium]